MNDIIAEFMLSHYFSPWVKGEGHLASCNCLPKKHTGLASSLLVEATRAQLSSLSRRDSETAKDNLSNLQRAETSTLSTAQASFCILADTTWQRSNRSNVSPCHAQKIMVQYVCMFPILLRSSTVGKPAGPLGTLHSTVSHIRAHQSPTASTVKLSGPKGQTCPELTNTLELQGIK